MVLYTIWYGYSELERDIKPEMKQHAIRTYIRVLMCEINLAIADQLY